MLDEGIEIYFPNDLSKMDFSQIILFGDHKMDILRILGNPNKEYLQGDALFLNYLELGLDVMFGNDYRVIKFILHTNYPYNPYFCFYNRCFYELKVNIEEYKEP